MTMKKGRRDKSDPMNEKKGTAKNDSPDLDPLAQSDSADQIDMDTPVEGEEFESLEQIDPALLLAECEQITGELKEQLLRKQAEFENFRKRVNREKEDSIRYANQMLLLDIVSVLDDFERAIKSADDSKDFDAFHSGVVLIEKQFISMLENKWNLVRFDSEGEPFDPDRHQAIAAEESSDYEKPTVLEDYQKGFLYHERVLRPAKVKVGQPKNETDETALESEEG